MNHKFCLDTLLFNADRYNFLGLINKKKAKKIRELFLPVTDTIQYIAGSHQIQTQAVAQYHCCSLFYSSLVCLHAPASFHLPKKQVAL